MRVTVANTEKNKQYAFKANKERKKGLSLNRVIGFGYIYTKGVFLNIRDLWWCTRGDGLFQTLERINDKSYKVDLSGEYDVSVTCNISDFSLFDAGIQGLILLRKEGMIRSKLHQRIH
jgi:hypothetical protein